MRSTNKSSTLRNTFTDYDQNKHDSVVSGSIITRETGYDCRVTLQYPYESGYGAQQDAVIKRASTSATAFLPFDIRTGLADSFASFIAVAKMGLVLIDNQDWQIDSADLWAELTADFGKMIANIAAVSVTDRKIDPDTAYVTANRPPQEASNS